MSERDFSGIHVEKLLVAGLRGFCAGVVRAIDVVEKALEVADGPVYVRKEIIHNRYVVDELRNKGARFVEEVDEVPDEAALIYSAHGIAPAVRRMATTKKLRTIDATCPLVTKVHLEAIHYARQGSRSSSSATTTTTRRSARSARRPKRSASSRRKRTRKRSRSRTRTASPT